MPQDYVPPANHIQAIHQSERGSLKDGAWLEATVPRWVPNQMKPKKFAKFQREIATRAWEEGGQTAEGAVERLSSYFNSERHLDKREAVRTAQSFFEYKTMPKLRRTYIDYLGKVLRPLMNSHFGKSEILKSLQNQSRNHEGYGKLLMIDEAYRPYVFREALRYVTNLPDFGPQHLPPEPSLSDIEIVATKAVERIEQLHVTPDLRGHGYTGVVSHEELDAVLDEFTGEGPSHWSSGHRAQLALKAGDILKAKGILVSLQELLEENGYR